MSKKLVSKSEFAQLAGVTAAAVTKQLKGRLAPALDGSRIDLDHAAAQNYLAEKTAPALEEPVQGVDPLFTEALENCRAANRWSASYLRKSMGVGYNRAVRLMAQLSAAGHCPAAPTPAGPSGQSAAPKPPPAAPANAWTAKEQLIEVPDDIEGMADMTLRELIEKFGTATRFHDWLKALKEIEAVNEKRIKNAQSRGRLISRSLVETGVIDPFNSAHIRLLTDGAKAITTAVLAKHQAGVEEQEIEKYVTDVVGSFIRPVKNKIERNLASVAVD